MLNCILLCVWVCVEWEPVWRSKVGQTGASIDYAYTAAMDMTCPGGFLHLACIRETYHIARLRRGILLPRCAANEVRRSKPGSMHTFALDCRSFSTVSWA